MIRHMRFPLDSPAPLLSSWFARSVVPIVLALLGPTWCFADQAGSLDLLIVNGRIWTGFDQQPEAYALGIQNGRFVFVDSRASWEKRQAGVIAKRTIDAQNRRVVPGFYDSHIHLLSGGLRLNQVALKDAVNEAELGRRLQEFDRKMPRDQWMLGGEWDHDRALKGQLPTAELLDRYVKDRPVFLRRYDGHMAVANSRALQLAGITKDTKDVAGGVIYRYPGSREPTGLLRDTAMSLVEKVIPPPTEEAMTEAVKQALAELASHGITSVQDMDGSDAVTRRRLFRLYQRLAQTGDLTCRIDLRWPLLNWRELADLGITANFGSDFLRIGGLKGFIDGSLGSSTAKFFAPYLNEPESTGIFVTPPAVMRMMVRQADAAGLSIAVHAIGDQGNAEMLTIFREVIETNGPQDRRFRIEHAQHLRPEDIRRFAEYGVIASMQPYHVIDDGRWAEQRIGPKRCATSYAFRALLDAGAILAFGSDWSVAPLNPMLGIDAAVNRRTLDGKHPNGWFPEQRITVQESLKAYTFGSAYAAFQEKSRGKIAPGYLGDCVILSRDILEPSERDHLAETQVLMTIVGGRVVYERPGTRPLQK